VNRGATKEEVADLIERFLDNRLDYPQQMNDFVECSQLRLEVDVYRKRCDVLCAGPVDEDGIRELRTMVIELRSSPAE